MLFGGGKGTVKDLADYIEKGIPCIIVEESGGLASLLGPIIRKLKSSPPPVGPKMIDAILNQTPKREGIGINPSNKSFRKCVENFDHFELLCAENFEEAEMQEVLLRYFLAEAEDHWPMNTSYVWAH